MATLNALKEQKDKTAYTTKKSVLRLRKQVRELVKMGWPKDKAENFVFERCGLFRNNLLLDAYRMADEAQLSRARVARAGSTGNRKQVGSRCYAMKNMYDYMMGGVLPNSGTQRNDWNVVVEKFNALAYDPEDVVQRSLVRVMNQVFDDRDVKEKTLDKVLRQTVKGTFDDVADACKRMRTFLSAESKRAGCYANPMDVLLRKDEARMKREMLQWYMDDLSLQEEWMLYLTLSGKTQQEVGDFLGVNRLKVQRKLAKLEQSGTPLTAYVTV